MSTTLAPAVGSAQFGVVGLGVMGQNLALNVSDHGQVVSVWNLEADWVTKFLTQHNDRKMTGSGDLKEFVQSLARPRRILMMIMAGNPVDQILLFCYHYDPATGKYGAVAMNMVRFAGAGFVLIGGTFLLIMFRRERRVA